MLVYFHSRGFQNVSQVRTVLRQAFQYALDESYITKNPFQKAKAPQVERNTPIALTEQQWAAYLLQYEGHPLEGLFHLYAVVSLRKGEGEGLRWADVDLKEGTISISQQYTEVNGTAVRSTPKTKRSRRLIPLPEYLIDMLQKHYTRQRKHAAATLDWTEQRLVFLSELGTPLSPSNINRLHRTMLKKAGLPETTVHGLRHTAMYLLEKAGAPESARMALFGHGSSSITRHYSDHASIDDVRDLFKKAQ